MKIKHFIFFLLLSFITIPIKAMTPTVEYIDGVYSNRITSNETLSGQLGFIVADGRVVFCLDPYELIGSNYEIDDNYFDDISADTLRYIQIVANYVDNYIQDRNIKYYMAAQELIWESIVGENKIYWTTQENSTGDIIDIETFKNDINAYVYTFNEKPSFDERIINGKFFDTIVLEDINNEIAFYTVEDNGGNDVTIEKNRIYITIKSNDGVIKLVRKDTYGTPIYYHSNVYQDLAKLSSTIETTSYIYTHATNQYNENIEIHYIDEETGMLVEGFVGFSFVNMNNNDEELYEIISGKFSCDLVKGQYKLSTINVPYGYVLPEDIIITVNEENDSRTPIYEIYLRKPDYVITINFESTGLVQVYNFNNILLNNIEESMTIFVEEGIFYVVDLVNQKNYEINLEYIDQNTYLIERVINILDSNRTDIEQNDDTNINNNDLNHSDNINQNNADELNQDKDGELNHDNNNNIDQEKDDIKDNNINSINDNKNNEIDNKEITIDQNNSNTNTDDKSSLLSNKQKIYLGEKVINKSRNIKTNTKYKMNQLPNTIDYMKIIKIIIILFIILVVIFDAKNNKD